jgi:hypothetical protein
MVLCCVADANNIFCFSAVATIEGLVTNKSWHDKSEELAYWTKERGAFGGVSQTSCCIMMPLPELMVDLIHVGGGAGPFERCLLRDRYPKFTLCLYKISDVCG